MHPIVQAMIPTAMFLLMIIIGMELTRSDFQRVMQFPRRIVVGVAAQLIGLPLLAGLLIVLLRPGPEAILGLLVFAVCPGGGMSNALSLYARANVAFSVTLTAVTTLASLVAIPVVLAVALWWVALDADGTGVPLLPMLGQLLFLVLIPILLGMYVRARDPGWVVRHYRRLRQLLLVLLVVIVGVSLATNEGAGLSLADFLASLPLALGFVAGSLLLGLVVAWLSKMERAETGALLIEFMQRNGGIMVLIIVGILRRPDLLALPTLCFALELGLAPVLVALLRWWQPARPVRGQT